MLKAFVQILTCINIQYLVHIIHFKWNFFTVDYKYKFEFITKNGIHTDYKKFSNEINLPGSFCIFKTITQSDKHKAVFSIKYLENLRVYTFDLYT